MRNVALQMFMTLDGVIEAPEKWSGQFWDDEYESYSRDRLFASDALLLGRVTYQMFAGAWPNMTDEHGYADRINSMPKYVASTTLETADEWNGRLIEGDVVEEVTKLKQQPGQDIMVYGSPALVNTLAENDLIDDYRIWVNPVAVGSGKRLFEGAAKNIDLRLVNTETFQSGITVLSYRPAGR